MSPRRSGPAAGSGALALALGLWVLATPGSARAQAASHQLSAYCTSGAMAYLSDARTIGGVGGGVGIRDTLNDRFLLQADLSYLTLLGNVAALRVGAGIQRGGTYSPAVLLTLSALMGDSLNFLTPQHFTPVAGPAVSLGVTVAPLRFVARGAQISLLQLGVGVGTDLPGLGLGFSIGALEIGASF